MSAWDTTTPTTIVSSDDLHIAPFRADGTTSGPLTWIWPVVVDGELYAGACNGTASCWHSSAVSQRAGRIQAAGRTHEVAFEPADPSVNPEVDAAYEAKYAGSPYLSPMIVPRTQSATVRVTPRS